MSKIRLYGSTSGYVELAAPDVSPDATLTLPATSGGFGKLVAVKHALKTDTFTASVAAGANAAVTDLSITHEVADAANRLIITVVFGVAANGVGQKGNVGVGVAVDGTLIAVGDDSADTKVEVSSGGIFSGTGATDVISNPSATFVYTPGAGSKTYTARAFNVSTSTATLYINRSENDSNSAFLTRGVSSLVIQEVAA